jgi:membrane associated rhomboid family serine protease
MRFLTKFEQPIFEAPGGMVQVLFGVNLFVYGLCLAQSGAAEIGDDVLLRYGAMTIGAMERHEYWRMIAYGFLHANPVHLVANMFLLILWGGHLEKRLGALYFAFVYVSGLAAGAVVSKFTSPGSYLLIGSAGALSAVFGALVYLWAVDKSEIGWEFFAISVGIAVALIAIHARIDWGTYLRGFAAGMICCWLLDIVEKVVGLLLRCKFPEFVKLNTFVAFGVAVAAGWSMLSSYLSFGPAWPLPVAITVAGLAIVKALDLTLTMKKGLVFIIVVLALTNAALVLVLKDVLTQRVTSLCGSPALGRYATQLPISYACTNVDVTLLLAAIGVLIVTVLLYWSHLARGIGDVGFVGNTLRAERLRYRGL